ncbi:hypothetical protein TL16_g05868 [Triparma laevis f. inornata]|uniref:Uncharacterized protein n=1 Tax=Triparma laevis f. inornata TaxID=1714386 RepID=A0A9W7EB63_9STRA|nr:hypothetical protein TL16_g05868 [Triparma laevis f. inornata]
MSLSLSLSALTLHTPNLTQLRRRATNTNTPFTNVSLTPNPLPRLNRPLQHPTNNLSSPPIFLNTVEMALTDLGEDLTFTDYEGIKASGDAEEVGYAVGGGEVEEGTAEDWGWRG